MGKRRLQGPGRRVQLHRALSKLGWGSRTQGWEWIRAGQVQVDGRVVLDPLTWVDLDRQRVTLAGRGAEPKRLVTLALNKPAGIVTTRSDERGRRTVYDLLPADLPWVFPAGRLDADSEGLLILTNDSSLAMRLTDPDAHVPKTYQLTLAAKPSAAELRQIREGMTLSDGATRPAKVHILEERPDGVVVELVLTEGRNRQARRMFAALGHRVRRLVRVAIGGYRLGDLPSGKHVVLAAADIAKLTSG